jgi:hypothetical protein
MLDASFAEMTPLSRIEGESDVIFSETASASLAVKIENDTHGIRITGGETI